MTSSQAIAIAFVTDYNAGSPIDYSGHVSSLVTTEGSHTMSEAIAIAFTRDYNSSASYL
jgi:hypothetical protein